jgi:restriction system protein
MFEVTLRHEGLHKYRIVKGNTQEEANLKADLQAKIWNEQWAKAKEREQRDLQKMRSGMLTAQRKELAAEKDSDAAKLCASMESLLVVSAQRDHRIQWSKFKHALQYMEKAPAAPKPIPIPLEPQYYEPTLHHHFWVSRARRMERESIAREEARRAWSLDHLAWETKKAAHEAHYKVSFAAYENETCKFKKAKEDFLNAVAMQNEGIDKKREAYLSGNAEEVIDYCEMVLDASEYPESFPSSFEIEYIATTKTLVVDFALPRIEDIPHVKGYKFITTKNEIQPIQVSDSWLNKTYDSVLYQIALRSLFELSQSDEAEALESIVFNGWVNAIDKSTGKEVNACVLSVHGMKSEIVQINMEQVDPKACFKKLKGVSAAKLVNLSPVRPILQMKRDDKRFVPSYNVAENLDDSANLAAMDWEDFEHLIREVFEKEFNTEGSEVKITQASRDGGVDAIAFDEDPIRGGKIVIQAKRYTNTVSVSAVRDLYGTILNEGANKGILVTTADYGPDAYEFAKGKPITLLSGSELLYLLDKHGHKARINLAEARLAAAENGQKSTA